MDLVEKKYELEEGAKELQILLKKYKLYKGNKNILELASFKNPIRLKQMVKTMEFTNPRNMIFYLIEMVIMIFISKISNLIYLAMIMSMYANSGLISLVYPLSVFGYALLEETRPK